MTVVENNEANELSPEQLKIADLIQQWDHMNYILNHEDLDSILTTLIDSKIRITSIEKTEPEIYNRFETRFDNKSFPRLSSTDVMSVLHGRINGLNHIIENESFSQDQFLDLYACVIAGSQTAYEYQVQWYEWDIWKEWYFHTEKRFNQVIMKLEKIAEQGRLMLYDRESFENWIQEIKSMKPLRLLRLEQRSAGYSWDIWKVFFEN